jgi:hypothetical protein
VHWEVAAGLVALALMPWASRIDALYFDATG